MEFVRRLTSRAPICRGQRHGVACDARASDLPLPTNSELGMSLKNRQRQFITAGCIRWVPKLSRSSAAMRERPMSPSCTFLVSGWWSHADTLERT